MREVVCVKVRLKANSLDRVRTWTSEMSERRAEALETLAAEGVWIETVFLDSSAEGDFLVFYMRADSLEHAARVASESTAAIDAIHREFKQEAWLEVQRLELLLDLARPEVQQIAARDR